MKTSIINKLFAMAALCLVTSTVSFAANPPLPAEQLPAKAQAFVQDNFERNSIVAVESTDNTYMCVLNDGTIIDFTKKGIWSNVDCNDNSIPLNFVPRNLLQYVYGNYPYCTITKVNKQNHGYAVRLQTEEGKTCLINVRFLPLLKYSKEI